MKISYKRTTPNMRQALTTKQIMADLTLALLVLSVVSVGYQYTNGMNYALKAAGIFLVSCLTAFLTELVFYRDIHRLSDSFWWVTALLFALTLPVGTPYYAVVVGSFSAILFGKLVFGGFGQNVFNPALVGRVIVHLSFGSQLTASLSPFDATSGATPLTQWASTSFLKAPELGLDKMLIGNYPGALGETFTALILVLGIFLIVRGVIDWRITASYLGTVILLAGIQALVCHLDLVTTVVGHLSLGGLALGAVFMATDPVTSPTAPQGKMLFGVGLGILTMLIRLFANFPEGVMFSILIMNMATPMIDILTMGKTNQKTIMRWASICCLFIVGCLTVGVAATSLSYEEEKPEENEPPAEEEPVSPYPEIINVDGSTYTVSAKGFGQQPVILKVTVDQDQVTQVSVIDMSGETEQFGQALLSGGTGESLNENAKTFYDTIIAAPFAADALDGIDTSTGATFTATGVVDAIRLAISEEAGKPAKQEDGVYVIQSAGFNEGQPMNIEVTFIDDQTIQVKVLSFEGETEGFGADLISGTSTNETGQAFYQQVLANPLAIADIDGIDTSTGATFTATGIMNAVQKALTAEGVTGGAGVYTMTSAGFNESSPMKVQVTFIDDETIQVAVLSYPGETQGFGADLIGGTSTNETGQAFYQQVLANPLAVSDVDGIDTSTGATFTASGIMNAIHQAISAQGGSHE